MGTWELVVIFKPKVFIVHFSQIFHIAQIYAAPPPIFGFIFWGFSYLQLTAVQQYEMENSINHVFKLHAFLVA